MRTLFAVSLVALLLGVGIVALIETDPGYVLISHGKYTLETSLWVGLVLLTAVFLLFFYLLRLVYRLISGQRTFVSWLDNRRSSQAQRASTRGLISYTEGNLTRARRQLLRGAENSDSPFANYLLAARTSDQLGDRDSVAELLQRAEDAEPDAATAVAIVRAEGRVEAGQYREALALLQDERGGAARHPRVLLLLQKAYEGLEDWDGLLDLLPDLRKHTQLTEADAAVLEQRVHHSRLQNASNTEELEAAWQMVPPALKQDLEMLRLYIRCQVVLGEQAAAEKSIVRALKKQWDPELVRQFGLLDGPESTARLRRAERWLPDHPQDAQLLLCLGRLCLRENLWGKARDYFESSYRVEPTPEVCAELGRLLLGLGEPKVAAAYYREGLAVSVAELPELPMPDKVVSGTLLLEREHS
ncbi:MAG: heme biosynthesis protein HemY [Halioglobus sp.]